MSLIGTYRADNDKMTLNITKADLSTGEIAGTLNVERVGPGGPFVATVEGHFHFFGSTGNNTSLVISAYADDIEGQSSYFAWAGFGKGSAYKTLNVRGGESVVKSGDGDDSIAVESRVTRFIR